MGRRDEYDDEEDRVGKPPRGGLPPGVWVLLGVAVVGAVMLAVGVAVNVGRPVETRPTQTEPANKLYTRDEFRALVMGKTMDEVLKAIGKPNSTAESPPDTYWYYRGITYDPVTGKTDGSVQVCIERGVVRRVNN